MSKNLLPPDLAASIDQDAREGARLGRIFRAIDRAYPCPPRGDYSPEWHEANRHCWQHSLGTMVDRYGLFEHWTTYYELERRYLEEDA